MSNEPITINQTQIKIWEDTTSLEEIRKLFAPKLNAMEFSAFVGLGKATGLNPFLKEIWSIKYSDKDAAQIFIGRDGYRKAAQKNPDYDYHQSDAVYSNDNFEVVNGEIRHSYKLTNRGDLIGAYCSVKRHSSSRPVYVYVPLSEYDTGRSVWSGKKTTMIKKVAEAQALRSAFQEQFGGTYGEDELDNPRDSRQNIESINGMSQTERAKQSYKTRKGLTNEYIDNAPTRDNEVVVDVSYQQDSQTTSTYAEPEEVVSPRTTENKVRHQENTKPINEEQLDLICGLIQEKVIDEIRLNKALHYFEVDSIESMNQSQADRMITMLGKLG